jgi:hypothetical protein
LNESLFVVDQGVEYLLRVEEDEVPLVLYISPFTSVGKERLLPFSQRDFK